MEIRNIKYDEKYICEYIKLCYSEWSNKKKDLLEYIEDNLNLIKNSDKVISILGLIDNKELIGFISLYKYDGEERRDLTPWYATMYVKDKYRGLGYSKILNKEIQDTARTLGYDKIYLKSNLINYYEKFEAKYIETLQNGENLYYMDLY